MANYVIITDSTCDLTEEIVQKMNIYVQPMTFRIQDREYLNYLDERELPLTEFYNLMRQGETATTAQLNIVDIETFFRPFLEKGMDILNIAFSSGLSGSYNASRLAAEELSEEFPDRKIMVIDSLCASGGEGVLVYQAALNREKGMGIEENGKMLEELKFKIRHWFTVDDIDTLRRGGRLTGAKAFAAKMLNIKPVLNVDNEGHLKAIYKKMGRRMAIRQLMESSINGYDKSEAWITIISHADCLEDAQLLKEMLEEAYQREGIYSEILLTKIGPVIGSHSGPGTLALFTIGDKR